jgi:hypothetical protein
MAVPDNTGLDAIKNRLPGQWQCDHLMAAANACWEGAQKVKGLEAQVKAFEACQGITDRSNAVCRSIKEIDTGIGTGVRPVPKDEAQKSSDKVYDATYWQYYGKTRDELLAAGDALLQDIRKYGLSPVRRAQFAAIDHLLNTGSYLPPIYDPNPGPLGWTAATGNTQTDD